MQAEKKLGIALIFILIGIYGFYYFLIVPIFQTVQGDEFQKSGLLVSLVAILLASVTLILQMIQPYFSVWKKRDETKEEQESLIENIKTQLVIIRQDTQNQINQIEKFENDKKTVIPQWIIPEIDSSFYVTHLKPKINGKDTSIIKMLMIEMENKAKDINEIWRFTNNSMIMGNLQAAFTFINVIKENNYQFHTHIIKVASAIESELEKLGEKQPPNYKDAINEIDSRQNTLK